MTSATYDSIDISGINTIDTKDGRILLRDNTDKGKQAVFDNWYMDKRCWENPDIIDVKAAKMKEIKWNAVRTSKIWDLFDQGAMLSNGRPIVYCVLCH